MFIVKIKAGLANQMFQYAFYKSLMENNHKVFVDQGAFNPKWKFENITLESIFKNIDINFAEPDLLNRFKPKSPGNLIKVKNRVLKILGYKDNEEINISNMINPNYIIEPKFSFNAFLFDLNGDYYLDGYWQSEKYFINVSNIIRKDFTFSELNDLKNIRLVEKISSENSISIHVRKGSDYKKGSMTGTCELEYYKAAIDFIKSKMNEAKFYVFSDNINWCKENLSFCNPTYVDWNPGVGPGNHIDMQLMSYCKHNIIANSSYSWWGAWLNINPEKIVIAPKIWFNKKYCAFDTTDIVPDNWIKL